MEQVSLGWLILEMTDSPFLVGVAIGARMVPLFLLGFVGGAVADRVDRRWFLRVITAGSGVMAGLVAGVLFTGMADVWHITVFAMGTGIFFAFIFPTRQAYTYDIVGPKYALNGLALSGMAQTLGGVIGAVVGGLLISSVGIAEQYVAAGVCYGSAALLLLATRDVGRASIIRRETVLANLAGYVRLLRENRTLQILMLLTATTEIFGFSHQTVLPVFAKDVLGVGATGLGVMTAFRMGGGVLGALLLANLGDFRRKGGLMFVMTAGFGVGQIVLYVTSNFYAALAVMTALNACAMGADTLYKTLMQDNVANEHRGRAMGSWVFGIGFAPIGHTGIGAIVGTLGAPMAFLINGSALAFISVVTAIGLPRIRRLP